jgi:hypothetical protein
MTTILIIEQTVAGTCPVCTTGILIQLGEWALCDNCLYTESLMDRFYAVHPPSERADPGPRLDLEHSARLP